MLFRATGKPNCVPAARPKPTQKIYSDNWIAGQRPLWLVAEVPRLHLKMWVTHEFVTLSVTTANSALPIDSRAYHESHTRRAFQNQREMAEYLEDLLSRKEAAV